VKVKIDVTFEGKQIKTWAWAFKTEFIDFPKKAWEAYAKGNAYDWTAVDHKDHSPEGYLRFCKKLTGVLKKSGVGVCGNYPFDEKKPPKLGDVVWSVKKKKFYLVDVA